MNGEWIGPAATLAGVALGGALSQLSGWVDRRNKREVLLRTKYEELATFILDSTKLPSKLMLAKTEDEFLPLTQQEDAKKAQMLAMIYFPGLSGGIGRYIDAYAKLCEIVGGIQNPQDSRILGYQIAGRPEYALAASTYHSAKDSLLSLIEDCASQYTRA